MKLDGYTMCNSYVYDQTFTKTTSVNSSKKMIRHFRLYFAADHHHHFEDSFSDCSVRNSEASFLTITFLAWQHTYFSGVSDCYLSRSDACRLFKRSLCSSLLYFDRPQTRGNAAVNAW